MSNVINITLNKGYAGPAGTDGTDGLSAYEIAVQEGFVGTEAEWLESLHGEDGSDATVTIEDNLESTDPTHVLSANQGRILKEGQDVNSTEIAAITNDGQVTKRIFLTQSEYDALIEIEENTEYCILEDEV